MSGGNDAEGFLMQQELNGALNQSVSNNGTLMPEIINGQVKWIAPPSSTPVQQQQQASIPQFQTTQTPTVNLNNISGSTGTTPTAAATSSQAPTNTLGAPPMYNSVQSSGGGKGGQGGGLPSSMSMPQGAPQAGGASPMPSLFNSVPAAGGAGVGAGGAK